MAVYITGDTHGGLTIRKLESKRFPEGKKLTKEDYLIVLGDFGIWKTKRAQDFLRWISDKKWTTLFVEGNHEDYEYLKTFPMVNMFGSKVRKINDSVYQLLRGEVYEIEEKKIFTFGGARSVDRYTSCRVEGVDWFPEEESTYEEECVALDNLSKVSNKVDFILTHTCSKSTLSELGELYRIYIENYDNQNKFLEEIKNNIEYSAWAFGHIHKDYRVNQKEFAVFDRVLNIEELLKPANPITFEKFTFSKNTPSYTYSEIHKIAKDGVSNFKYEELNNKK